jgi:hypothetical protein
MKHIFVQNHKKYDAYYVKLD